MPSPGPGALPYQDRVLGTDQGQGQHSNLQALETPEEARWANFRSLLFCSLNSHPSPSGLFLEPHSLVFPQLSTPPSSTSHPINVPTKASLSEASQLTGLIRALRPIIPYRAGNSPRTGLFLPHLTGVCSLFHLHRCPPTAKDKTFKSGNSRKRASSSFPVMSRSTQSPQSFSQQSRKEFYCQWCNVTLHPVGSKQVIVVETGRKKNRNRQLWCQISGHPSPSAGEAPLTSNAQPTVMLSTPTHRPSLTTEALLLFLLQGPRTWSSCLSCAAAPSPFILWVCSNHFWSPTIYWSPPHPSSFFANSTFHEESWKCQRPLKTSFAPRSGQRTWFWSAVKQKDFSWRI